MSEQMLFLLGKGTLESLYMVIGSAVVSYMLGIPLGVALYVTGEKGIRQNRAVNQALGIIANMLRSVPFIILFVAILPFTRLVAGTTIGPTATIVPLVVASAPFIARMVESSLNEVDAGILEAAQAIGASPWQIIVKVLLPEAKPSLITGATIAVTTILGYSAMAGFAGGGGLGSIAINYGYYRYQTGTMMITVVLLVIIVQIFQEVGMRIVNKTDKRKKA